MRSRCFSCIIVPHVRQFNVQEFRMFLLFFQGLNLNFNDTFLVLFALHERAKGAASFWHPYLNMFNFEELALGAFSSQKRLFFCFALFFRDPTGLYGPPSPLKYIKPCPRGGRWWVPRLFLRKCSH